VVLYEAHQHHGGVEGDKEGGTVGERRHFSLSRAASKAVLIDITITVV
jgi:hypothetical protein